MSHPLHERERKIDVSKMSIEEVDNISAQVSEKVRNICDEAAKKINTILAIYGMSAKIAIAFDGLPNEGIEEKKAPKKRGRKPNKENKEEQS